MMCGMKALHRAPLGKVVTVVGPGTTMVDTQLAATPTTTPAAKTDFTVVTAEEPTRN